ncbi:hypothetical protein WN943_008314 [Citrus x changshan-huyou]
MLLYVKYSHQICYVDEVVLLKTKKRYSGRWEQEDDLVGFVSTSL